MDKLYFVLLGMLIGAIVSSIIWMQFQQKSVNKWKGLAEKNIGLFAIMNKWTKIKQEQKSLIDYFEKHSYRKIAIYGMGSVGIRLVSELKDTDIQILYGIDKNKDNVYSDIPICFFEDEMLQVDAIVVTVIGQFDEIKEALLKRVNCEILAIEDVLNVF